MYFRTHLQFVGLQYLFEKGNEFICPLNKNQYSDYIEAIIIGVFMFAALFTGHLLEFRNPYWIPISCIAVMQGATLYQIWQRSFHRILGTFIGLGFCWLFLHVIKTPLSICITIIILQFIIEILVVRQYALAVIFITPMTILLAEAANPLIKDPNMFISIRFWEIAIGSIMGAIGGWIIHHEKIRYHTIKRIRKTRMLLKRR